MATSSISAGKFDIHVDDTHAETFCLIWLDANPAATGSTEQKLRSIINHLKKFQDVKLCQNFIEKRSKSDRLIMIVSGRLGREIVPNIYNLRQIIAIYIYCMDKEGNKKWALKYKKVKTVVTAIDELVAKLKADHKIQKVVDEPFSYSTYSKGKSTTGARDQFVFSQVLIDCLLRLKYTDTDRKEFFDRCKKQYEGNSQELKKICEFEEEYTPEKALWWYSRESFFYKTLNAILRNEDVHMTFLFRAFIYDIYCQLQNYHTTTPMLVYRGQKISRDELDTLQKTCGQFISINSFFSTSADKEKALKFLSHVDPTDDSEKVLFVIDAVSTTQTTKPFGDITKYCYSSDESEVLFMLGSIFRLNSVDRSSSDSLWTIKMTWCDENMHHVKEVFLYIKQKLGTGEINLEILGKILSEMGKPDLAEKYFLRLLQQLPHNSPSLCSLYEGLAQVASQKGDYDQMLKWRQKAMALIPNQLNCTFVISEKHGSRVIPNIPANARWKQNGITIAGGNGDGNNTNQLSCPLSLVVDDDQTVIIAEYGNNRIVQWKKGDVNGQIIAGGNGPGNRLDQLHNPTDVLIDKETDSLIIADLDNRRVVRWSRLNGTKQGEILIDNIVCNGLAMDEQGYLYVSDCKKDEVRRYRLGEQNGTLVAGGNGEGNGLNQLKGPKYLFVDRQQNVYVSDEYNHRVMKWSKGAKEGIVVAGGNGEGNALTQLHYPHGIFVDILGTLYVADAANYRVMRWSQGDKQGTIIVGGNSFGAGANQFYRLHDLTFDHRGNLYATDGVGTMLENNRVQRFDIIK